MGINIAVTYPVVLLQGVHPLVDREWLGKGGVFPLAMYGSFQCLCNTRTQCVVQRQAVQMPAGLLLEEHLGGSFIAVYLRCGWAVAFFTVDAPACPVKRPCAVLWA